MTGPGHYVEAERLLAEVHRCRIAEDGDPACPFCARSNARAQVHATLALAAATVRLRTPTAGNWDEVLR